MLRHSQSEQNPNVHDWTEPTEDRRGYEDLDNLSFFTDALRSLDEAGVGSRGVAVIGLVGHRDLPGVALRRAQSVLRWDRRPSLWSHAFLLVQSLNDGTEVADLPIREVTLHSRTGAFPEPGNNAITDATLGNYSSKVLDANVALIAVRSTTDETTRIVDRAVKQVNLERLRYDLWETLGLWQSYLWTRGTPNPLEQGVPMHSSSFVEYCFEAIPLDLTPGATERNSAPEHVWNGARWWTDTFDDFEHPIHGRYVLRDRHCGVLDADELAAEWAALRERPL